MFGIKVLGIKELTQQVDARNEAEAASCDVRVGGAVALLLLRHTLSQPTL